MQYLWEQNTKWGIRIKVAEAWTHQPSRVHDKAIMDIFRSKEKDKVKLERLNDVRLYLKITYISCMTNEAANKIENWALVGPPKNLPLDWPVRRRPLQ